MDLGSQTQVVNGQRNIFPTWSQFNPTQYGPQTTGVPQISPTMPPFLGGQNAAATMGAGMDSVGGYGTAGNNGTVTAIAAANPHNLKVSPVWWAVGLLIVGLLLLNGVHWRKVTLEGFEEHAHVGGVSEGAHEETG